MLEEQQSYHILNGDALRHHFPTDDISGDIIVARECLVDGPVKGETLEALYQCRIKFLEEHYGADAKTHYHQSTIPQFQKIQSIPTGADVNLWFEDDLFCQVNLWFVLHLLHLKPLAVFLVRPKKGSEYSFGHMNQEELKTAFSNKKKLASSEISQLNKLWSFYQNDQLEEMIEIARGIKETLPFVLPAVLAHERIIEKKENSPINTLKKIMVDLDTTAFVPVFKAFSKSEAIYGFGDLQVKRLMDQIK